MITGQVLSDSLPIVAQTASRQINAVGSFTGSLTLAQDTAPAQRAIWMNALLPWKSILWILQDGKPIWNGPITGWPHGSLSGGNLPLQGATIEEMFKHRQITDTLTYTNMDIFEIFRQFLLYAVGKTNGNIAGSGQYANQSGIIDTVEYSGVIGSVTEAASLKYVYDVWNDLIQTYLMEYALTPGITDSGSLFTQVQMGLPQLGRTYDQTHWQLIIPSHHMQDYGWQWAPTNPVNSLVVTGSGATSSFTATAVAQSELAAGYPLLEGSTSFSGTVSSQAQLNSFATGSLYPLTVLGNLAPVVMAGDGAHPAIADVILGDEAMFAGTSDLHPAGAYGVPGVTELFQITGWTLTFPNGQQPEQIAWQLGPILEGTIT
jgi:hypothetical protein